MAIIGCVLAGCGADPEVPHQAGTASTQQGLAQGGQPPSVTLGSVTTSPGTGWSATGSLASERLLHTATRLQDGRVLVVGGYEPSAELYDPATGTWSSTGPAPGNYRRATATLLPSGKVLVTGAPDSGVSAALYDPASGAWSPTGNLARSRQYHTATLLPNGRVLVAGGADPSGTTLASAELYDPATGAWTAAAGMGAGRREHAAVLLPSGQVLVAGGRDSDRLSSAELYDPATNTWTNAGAMATARANYTATVLPSGKVLVAGGGGDGAAATTAELYDPASRSWSAAHGMHEPRRRHTATLLPSGQVLVAGGYDSTTGIHASSELYDPAHDAWYAMASMAVDRYEHTATLLANGRVLVAGGFSNGDQASAELYAAALTKVVLDAGPGWQLVNVSGAESNAKAQPFNADLYVLDGALGITNAPLPEGFRAQLAQAAAIKQTVHYLDKKIIDELRIAEQLGTLTPALEAIAEPPVASVSPGAGLLATGLGGEACPERRYGMETALEMKASPSTSVELDVGVFKGSLQTTGELTASANAQVSTAVTFSHFQVPLINLDVCIPTGVQGSQLNASGSAALNFGYTMTGTLKDPTLWQHEIAKVNLGVITFVIPGIQLPVVISIDMPVSVGIGLEASVSRDIQYSARLQGSVAIDASCTLDGCTASTSSPRFEPTSATLEELDAEGISGHIKPSVWAEIALRADLYKIGAYLQIGVRPTVDGDLWGYTGNTCGDADGDGQPEQVSAATFGLDANIHLVGEASAPFMTKKLSLILDSVGNWYIAFWDLLSGGSSALRPMLAGPGSVGQGFENSYDLKMRPCWPYTDAVDYRLQWEANGPLEEVSADPKIAITKKHSWSALGPQAVTATALRDRHGRVLNTAFERSIQVSSQSQAAAHYVTQFVPPTMEAGKTYTATVIMRNDGVAWSPGVHFLGSQNPSANAIWGMQRVYLPRVVGPGEEVSFTFDVTAPSTAGSYAFQWQMLQDGAGYFGDATQNVLVEVSAPTSACTSCEHFCGQRGQGCSGECDDAGVCECVGQCRF